MNINIRAIALLFSTDEETCVFKCSVSRETECSRVGKQSFIITLGCNSVLLQFASPAGKVHLLLQVISTAAVTHGVQTHLNHYRHL